MELIERVARAIASEVWHDEPDQIDQMAVDWIGPAKAAIRAMLDGVESNLSAVQYDPAPYTAMKHRIAAMRKEVE